MPVHRYAFALKHDQQIYRKLQVSVSSSPLCVESLQLNLSSIQAKMMRGEPLLSKMALVAKYVVFPGAMLASIVYCPPDYNKPNKKPALPPQYSASS